MGRAQLGDLSAAGALGEDRGSGVGRGPGGNSGCGSGVRVALGLQFDVGHGFCLQRVGHFGPDDEFAGRTERRLRSGVFNLFGARAGFAVCADRAEGDLQRSPHDGPVQRHRAAVGARLRQSYFVLLHRVAEAHRADDSADDVADLAGLGGVFAEGDTGHALAVLDPAAGGHAKDGVDAVLRAVAVDDLDSAGFEAGHVDR